MKAILLILTLLIIGCGENAIEPAGEPQKDNFTNTGSYTGSIKLGQNDTLELNENNTRLHWFSNIFIQSTGVVEVIGNYGDLDLNLTKLELEGVQFVKIVVKNFNEDTVTVNINLKQ